MSTLSLRKIKHDSSAVDNITLASSGSTAVTNLSVINTTNPTSWVSVDSGLTTQSMYLQANTTSGDTRIGSYTNHPLGLYTNNIERLRIDTSGRATMPYQPSFLIRKTTGQTGSGGTTIVASFDTARDNIGSHFNTTTSTFTAPIAGRYLLTALLNVNRNSATYFNLLFQINGANIGNVSSLFYSQPSWTALAQTIIVNLSANDAVRVVVGHDNNATLDNSGYFSGMLLG